MTAVNEGEAVSPALARPPANGRGIAAMVAAMALFSGSDALVKLATEHLPAGQIMTIRGAFAMATVGCLLLWRREHGQVGKMRDPRVLFRAAVEAATTLLFVVCVARLPLASITAILQATPIIIGLIAMVLGLERVGPGRWAAILTGFAGVLLIVRPTPSGFDLYALLTLATAFLVATRDLATRGLATHIPTTVVTLSTTIVTTGAGLALSLAEGWRAASAHDLMLLGGAALFVTFGNLAVVQAFRIGEVSAVSPFRYVAILTSLAAGFLLFGEWPDALAGLGIGLIALSGVQALHGERRRTRAAGAAR